MSVQGMLQQLELVLLLVQTYVNMNFLTHRSLNEIATILQTIFSNVFHE